MNIGIITQPIAANYGCNLQAFALQTILERMGGSVLIIDRWDKLGLNADNTGLAHVVKRFTKDIAKMIMGSPVYHSIEIKDRPYYWQNFIKFQKKYLNLSHKMYSTDELEEFTSRIHFDAFVVGSDQVWRPAYNLGEKLYNMYLDFTSSQEVKRIAYAASFGVDKWEYSEAQTHNCKKLIGSFDAVSVREKSGVDLCMDYYDIEAKLVLDPTLLLGKEDYNKIINNSLVEESAGELFCYFLDSSSNIKNAIKNIEDTTGLKSYTCLPLIPENTYNPFHKSNCILPSVEQWLKSFQDANLVLADSFHGMVFSIIYNKPFWIVGNAKRGISRFTSLLDILGLRDRIVSVDYLDKIDLLSPINWELVNYKIMMLKKESVEFLENALKY